MQAPDAAGRSVFDPDMVILAVNEGRLRITDTLRISHAIKGLIMRTCSVQPPPEWVSGHRKNGSVSSDNHMAIVPLPLVGCWRKVCDIAGFAVVLPRGLDRGDVDACIGHLVWEKTHTLFAGRRIECSMRYVQDGGIRWLDASMWTGPARTWASVTPVVLDKHCRGADMWEKTADVVSLGCERVGLPRPESVNLSAFSSVPGVPSARRFPPVMRKNGSGSVAQTHAVCVFGEKVTGPVIIGAGRYRGYGMFVPLE